MYLDPSAIPFLMKAVDFLFGEGSKILEERRERRKQKTDSGDNIITEKNITNEDILTNTDQIIKTREQALQAKISEAAIKSVEEKINHLLELLDIHQKNYQLTKAQYSKWGSALVPQIVLHNLDEAEDRILETTKELQSILSRVYGKPVEAIKE